MPVACAKSQLSGIDGSVAITPAGTRFCLKDHTDFPAGAKITVPLDADYRVGDPVKFTAEGAAKLDTAITGALHYVVATGTTPTPYIEISDTKGGTPVTLAGDGGTGTADTANPDANHIKIAYAEHLAVCDVQSWSVDMSREQVDTTALQCGPSAGGGALAPFRTRQAGYVDGSGNIVVRFTKEQAALSRRLLQNSLRKNQDGASVQLFIDTVWDANGKHDLPGSDYLEGPISILGFSLGVTVGSDPTQGTINFSFSDQPTNVFGVV